MNKKYQIIKTIYFFILGILVFIFNEFLTTHAYILVSMIMLLYGFEDITERYVRKILSKNISRLSSNILIIILGIICIFLRTDEGFVPLCIIWATWAILREEWEVEDAISTFHNKFIMALNLMESIAVIIISISFIFSPTVHHIHLHVILLGFELILEVLFPLIDVLLRKEKKEEQNEETNIQNI